MQSRLSRHLARHWHQLVWVARLIRGRCARDGEHASAQAAEHSEPHPPHRPHRWHPRAGEPGGEDAFAGRHAERYGRVAGWALGWLYRSAATQVAGSLPHGAAVLDVGTGPGKLLIEIARRRPDVRVIGIDPSLDMLRQVPEAATAARSSGRIALCVATAEHLPFPGATFDAVVSTLSAHHWADARAAVAEQARVLRPDGLVWIYDMRGHDPSPLLGAEFGPAHVTAPPLGPLASVVLACRRATKPGAPNS